MAGNSDKGGNLNRIDFLWKTVGRYDFYIGTTNAKAAALLAYNTFVVGGIVLKFRDVLALFDGHSKSAAVGAVLLIAASLASIVSLWSTFVVVLPYLWSPKKPNDYHSLIFFNHVAEYSSGEDYCKRVDGMGEAEAVKDLSYQTHALATGTRKKFNWLRLGIGSLLFAQVPAFAMLLLIKLWIVVADAVEKLSRP